MTRANRGLIRPSGSACIAGLLLSLASLILIGLALALSWRSAAGWLAAGFVICLSLLGQIAIGTVFSPLTAARAGFHLAGETCPINFKESLRKNWLDLAFYSLAQPGLWLASQITGRKSGSAGPLEKTNHQPRENGTAPNGDGAVSQPVETAVDAGLEAPVEKAGNAALKDPDYAWIKASYMIIPIMGMEGLSLKESLPRAAEFISSHALRLSIDVIGVRGLTWLTSGLLTLLGIAAGWIVYRAGSPLSHAIPLRAALVACLAILVFNLFILAAVAISSYLNTVYATCLYLWSRSVEKARLENLTEPASVPVLLSVALAK